MIIETGTDLIKYVKAEGPENTVLRLYDLFDLHLYRNSIKHLSFPSCLDPFEHSLDIKQDTWLSAFLDLRNFYEGKKEQEYQKPLGWLLTINKHKCFKHLKKCKKFKENPPLPEGDGLQDSIVSVSTPLDRLIEEENQLLEEKKQQKLLNIISTMSSKEQKVLKMYSEGLSHKAIAVMLEITQVNSRQIFCRAAAKIEKLFQQEGEDQ